MSVSRSIFPILTAEDAAFFGHRGHDAHDQIGIIDSLRSTFGKTYAAEPDKLVEQIKADAAVAAAATFMLTIPSQLGVEYNLHILESLARYVAPRARLETQWERPVDGL